MRKKATGKVTLDPDSETVLEAVESDAEPEVEVDIEPQDVEVGELEHSVRSDEDGEEVVLKRKGGDGKLIVDYTVYMSN